MLDKKDINRYSGNTGKVPTGPAEDELAISAGATAKTLGSMVWKAFLTVFIVLSLAGLLVLISVASFIWSLRNEEVGSLSSVKLNFSSNVYVKDKSGKDVEYMTFHRTENRTWVDFNEIPQAMKDAQVAIEDKRFYKHEGVDWSTTFGAVYKLATGKGGAGGSTLTQQLIKNVTLKDEISLLRKVKEIFSALNMEKAYSKDQILEYYLNLVNYGYGCNGVQAAANTYFGKDIKDCSLAECAAIAGITQNPYAYTPILFPENTKKRQLVVLEEMLDQGYITKAEHTEAVKEANNMKYVFKKTETGTTEEKDTTLDSNDIWDWYTETMVVQLINDMQEQLNISYGLAEGKLFNEGLSIFSAVDMDIQKDVVSIMRNSGEIVGDPEIDMGFMLMDYKGRVVALCGSQRPKTINRGFNNVTNAKRQPGSSIKPLSVYAPALDAGAITYSTVIKDQPIKGYYVNEDGPSNYSMTYRNYMNVDKAVEISQNAPAAHIVTDLGVGTCFNFLVERFHMSTLVPKDQDRAPLATGGMDEGVTVWDMTAAFATFGNGGNYYKPYTYYYVLDHDGAPILDNREPTPSKAMSEVNANIMNKLLHMPIYGGEGTGNEVQIDGLDIFGKTGTTDSYKDLWFAGGTPYGVAAIWNGYGDQPRELETEKSNKQMWRAIINHIWENYWSKGEAKSFSYTDQMVDRTFCRASGLLAGGSCGSSGTGWYDANNLPRVCNGGSDHSKNGAAVTTTTKPKVTATAKPTPVKTPEPLTPTPGVATPEPVTPPPADKTPEPVEPSAVPPTDPPPPTEPPPPTDPPATEPPPPTDPPATDPPPPTDPPATDPPPVEPDPPPATDPPTTDPEPVA